MGLEGPHASRAILWRPAVPKKNGAGHQPNLYWVPRSQCPIGEGVVAFATDDKPQFVYEPFNQGRDFGPLDIARTVMYCRWVEALCNAHAGCSALVHVVSDASDKERANSVALCGAYLVLCCGASAEEAYRPFAFEPLPPFVDCRGEAAPGSEIADEEDFRLLALDILQGLQKARDLSWVDCRIFDVEDHSSSLRPERGDMSWLLPGKALALASPWAEPHDQDGLPVCTPALLCPYFLRHGVSLIVQCNNPEREEEGDRRRLLCYTAQSFRDMGIAHLFLPFEDGGCPSVDVILRFLAEVEAVSGCFAVHCRSGLGRTATLIGIYAMRHLGFTARSFIGWARSMRPGTVHGSQQQYLVNLEPYVKVGAPRSLADLDQRERLKLLPHRELRFWALDSGIPAIRTRHSTEADMIEMILVARGISVPRVYNPPSRASDTPPARSLAPVLRTQQQVKGTGHLLPQPTGAKPLSSASPTPAPKPSLPEPTRAFPSTPSTPSTTAPPSTPARSEAAAVAKAVAKEVAQAPQSESARKSEHSLNSLNAAIASLGRSLHNSSAVMNGQTATTTPAPVGSSTSTAESTSADTWAEVLRYLHLHAAMQEEGNDAGARVRQTVELLRTKWLEVRTAVEPSCSASGEKPSPEVAKLSEAYEAAKQRVAENEQQLRVLQQQAQAMQRETTQLRTKLARDQEAQNSIQMKNEERGEALAASLSSDEQRLEGAVREVEELRSLTLKRGGLEQQQVDRVEQLRKDIQEARQSTLHHNLRCRELKARLQVSSGNSQRE